jgi:hypothetical protein
MDNARFAANPPLKNAKVGRPRKLKHRLLLWLPEISLVALVAGLVFAGFQLLGGSGSTVSSSGSAAVAAPVPAVSQVYSVDQVLSGLQLDTSAWIGQSFQVQGVLEGPLTFCGSATPCPPEQLALMDNGNGILASDQYLPISSDDARSLPFNVLTTFTVQLQAAPDACALNPAIVCFAGTNPAVAAVSQ